MGKAQFSCVQALAAQQRPVPLLKGGAVGAVHLVTHHGMADVAHVYADLVGAPRFQHQSDVGKGSEIRYGEVVGDRLTDAGRAAGQYRHLLRSRGLRPMGALTVPSSSMPPMIRAWYSRRME